MKIEKQAVITWLLDKTDRTALSKIAYSATGIEEYDNYLIEGLSNLRNARLCGFDWGLPEMVMSSFAKVMHEAGKSFIKIEEQLFNEFCESKECGILLIKMYGTIVYCFHEGHLFVWLFREQLGLSKLYLFFWEQSTNEARKIYTEGDIHKITASSELSFGDLYGEIAAVIITYLAVKKYAKVETVIVPNKKIDYIKNLIPDNHSKEVIRNESGQDVIIMDSRWFRRIVNDNDIFVRGFWRLQNKKNEKGEWYKELIFVDSFVRHGYHRNAKIEELADEIENS